MDKQKFATDVGRTGVLVEHAPLRVLAFARLDKIGSVVYSMQ